MGDSSRCFDCNVNYHSGYYDIFCKYKNTLYCLQVRYGDQYSHFMNRAILIKGHPGYNYERVVEFKTLPANITPQNILNKIKTYLTFS